MGCSRDRFLMRRRAAVVGQSGDKGTLSLRVGPLSVSALIGKISASRMRSMSHACPCPPCCHRAQRVGWLALTRVHAVTDGSGEHPARVMWRFRMRARGACVRAGQKRVLVVLEWAAMISRRFMICDPAPSLRRSLNPEMSNPRDQPPDGARPISHFVTCRAILLR